MPYDGVILTGVAVYGTVPTPTGEGEGVDGTLWDFKLGFGLGRFFRGNISIGNYS